MTMKKETHHHHYPPKTIIPFLLVFLLGVFIVIFFHPQIWFNPLSEYLTDKISQDLNAELSISHVHGNFNRAVFADSLRIRNKNEHFSFDSPHVSIHYRNILALAVTRSIDTLEIVHPVFINGPRKDASRDNIIAGQFDDILKKFPSFKIHTLIIKKGAVYDSQRGNKRLVADQISGVFTLNTRGQKTSLNAQSMSFRIPEKNWYVDSLNFAVSYANGLIKLQNLTLLLDDTHIHLTGKGQPVENLPFKGELLIQNIHPAFVRNFTSAEWTSALNRNPEDILDIVLTFSGNDKSVRTDFSVQGIFMDEIIDKCEGHLRYLPPKVEVNHLAFHNSWLQALVSNASYEKGFITIKAELDQLNPPFKHSFLTDLDLQGSFSGTGRIPDSIAFQYDFKGEILNKLSMDYLGGAFLFHDNNIILTDTNRINMPGAVLNVTGRLESLSDLDFLFSGKTYDFKVSDVYNRDLSVDNATVQGRLKGPLHNPDLSFIYLLNNAAYGAYSLTRARGAASVKELRSNLSGNFYVDFSQLDVQKIHFDGGGLFLDFLQDTVVISSLNLSSGDNKLELVGKASLDSLIFIDGFAANIEDNTLYLLTPFQLDFRKNSIDISPLSMRFNDGVIKARGSHDRQNRIQISASGENLDISELLSVWNPDISADGAMQFDIDLSGTLTDPVMKIGSDIQNFSYDKYTFNDLSVSFHFADSMLSLEKARLRQGKKSYMNTFGRFPLQISFLKGIDLTFPMQTPFLMTTEVNQTSLDILTELSPRIERLSGVMEGILSASGTYEDPVINLNLTTRDFTLNQFGFNRILSRLDYENKKITIKNINFINEKGEYSITGHYPFDLQALKNNNQTINGSQDSVYILVEGKDRGLAYLVPVIRGIEDAEGTFITHLTLSGPVDKPVKSGSLKIEDATLTIANVLNPVRNISGELTVINDQVHVDLKGNMEKTETRIFRLGRNSPRDQNVELTGTMDLDNIFHPALNLRARGNNVHIKSLNDRIDVVGDGELRITGRDTISAVGFYATHEGLLNFDFKRPLKKQEPRERKREFVYILEVPIDKNVYLRNELVDAELEGNIVLEKRAGESQILAGNLSIRSGKFYYYSSIFDIESGEIIFDPYANNITLDFVASTSVMNGSNRIIATLSGDIDKPVIELRDEKNMFTTQAEIIQLLTTGKVGSGQIVTGTAQSYLETIFEKELERTASEWGRFERVDLKTTGPLFENPNLDSVSILLERRIGKDLYLSYEQSLSNEKANRNVELEYRLNRNFSIIGEADDESVSFSYRIRFQY
jgi:hypothetical protein